jgi:hypothetical protein
VYSNETEIHTDKDNPPTSVPPSMIPAGPEPPGLRLF